MSSVSHTKPIQFIIAVIFSQVSLVVSAQEDYFVPTVIGESVVFSAAPIITRDSAVQLVVSGPNDFTFEKLFSAGEQLLFNAKTAGVRALIDGQYSYELTFISFIRSGGDRGATPIDLEGKTNDTYRKSGTLSILSGLWVNPDTEESGSSRDDIIIDDLIVQGSACIGIDCVNNESFDFDTLRIKENNTRIRFSDTSNSASFPSSDWELRANDTTNGGANKFSIADLDNDVEILSIEAGAPANSMFVDDRGRVGFGTASPLLDQHILSGNTPSTRYQQDGSGGFPSQTWDIGGNEVEFFIRDFSSSQVPFSIEPGAPSNSLVINAAGDIEIIGSILTVPVINTPNKILNAQNKNNLQDLKAVEQHIQQYQQLPGIDDQTQDLVKLQLQLLEKVQELTLYTIEQEKRINELESKLAEK